MKAVVFEDVLKKIKLDLLDQVYFNQATYTLQFSANEKRVVLSLYLLQTLPFTVYVRLLKALEEKLKISVRIIIYSNEQNLESKEINAYIRNYLKDRSSVLINNSTLTLFEEQTCFFIVDSLDLNEIDQEILHDCEKYLKSVGIQLNVALKLKEEKEVIIESKQREVAINENQFNQTLIKKTRLKYDEYEFLTLDKVHVGQKNIRVQGEIFQIEDRWINGNTRLLKTFSIHDSLEAISFVKFLDKEDETLKYSQLHEGMSIEVFGDIVYDNYGKDIQINAKEVKQIANIFNREDNATIKRIELHAHSNMSEMDGVSSVEAYIEQAFKWGHEGFAITDHNNVQCYPKAQRLVESLLKKNPQKEFKMIYGCEFDTSDNHLNIVYQADNRKLNEASYVVFDLETTGLSKQNDRIIEFGGIKVVQGIIVERLQMFVNPQKSLSPYISKLTNIKDEMLKDAPLEKDCVLQWQTFISDSVLVAHNASFDSGFLNQAFIRNGLSPLSNPVIDSLDLSKALIESKRSYRLGAIAKHYKLDYNDGVAHRADYDAEVLLNIFLKWINSEVLKDLTLQQLYQLGVQAGHRKLMKYHVTVLAKDSIGLKDIFKLVSIAHTDSMVVNGKDDNNNEARLKREDLEKRRSHLLIGSSCLNGEIFDLALTGTQKELEEAMSFYDFIEVQAPENYKPLIDRQSIASMDELKKILKTIIDTALKLKIYVVATGDTHYLHPKDKQFRDVYIQAKAVGSSRHPLYIYNEEKRKSTSAPNQHFRTTEEMLEAFSFIDASIAAHLVIHTPRLILNQIETLKPVKKDLYTPQIEGADDKLRTEVYKNAIFKYGENLPKIVSDRIEKELNSITKHGFGVIYYIAHLLVKKSLEDGYMVGSRGSVGSSLVATLSNITEVNPLPPHYVCPHCHTSIFIEDGSVDSGFDLIPKKCPECQHEMDVDGHDIPFETFLGFEGDKVPDIDLNFSGDYQDKAHAYTKVLFGEEHVFRAGTISTVAQRTAYGYVKGYFEELGIETLPRQAFLNYLAKGCEGIKRTTGQHPGGIIVIPQDNDVYDFTPVQYPANKSASSWLTTHFEFADIHDNVLKLDILGHVDPTAMKMLERISGIDVRSIKMNDQSAIQLFSSINGLNILDPSYPEATGAVGLPEFGTNFVRQILAHTKPSNFSDLVRVSGLSHGTDVWLNNAKDLILEGYPFRDVIGCRDDIMIYLIHKGLPAKSSFDIMESVRKGKGLKDEWKKLMAEYEVPEWYIHSCLKIKYMFPKAHAVAYVLMAVRVAWFKVHQPLVYYASFFTLRTTVNDYETIIEGKERIIERLRNIQHRLSDSKLKSSVSNKEEELINSLEVAYEMTVRGFYFSKLDLNLSLATEYRLHPSDKKALIPPFSILDGLGGNVANSIIEAREDRVFLSKEDLQNRTLLNNTHLKQFERFGLLHHLDDENQLSLF